MHGLQLDHSSLAELKVMPPESYSVCKWASPCQQKKKPIQFQEVQFGTKPDVRLLESVQNSTSTRCLVATPIHT